MDGSHVSGGLEPGEEQSLKAGAPVSRDESGQAAELDLDRLVWDPEYRRAMRPLIERDS